MTQLPERFRERMKGLLGEDYRAFEEAMGEECLRGLRLNGLKIREGRQEGWEELAGREAERIALRTGFTLTPVPWAKEGFYYGAGQRPGKHPYHEAGVYYIQEPSAMAVGELMNAAPGERILDLCAAPGGKSSHIASRMKGEGLLLSNELHPARAAVLSQNMERMGAGNCVVSNEEPVRLAQRFPAFFDGVVVDAPCSGEGMFRKDEEAAAQWSEELVARCAARQDEILDCAAVMTRPGGRIVYSTCTFAPEEDEGTVWRFLRRHPEFALEQPEWRAGFAQGRPDWIGSLPETGREAAHLERTVRLMPHLLKGEGHFAAVLRRAGDSLEMPRTSAGALRGREASYLDKRKNHELWRLVETFLRDTLTDPERFTQRKEYICFGEQVYLAPAEMPDMAGMRILRPGLHMGTIKKNRFEPSQALAEALLPQEAVSRLELASDEPGVLQYLRGEAIPLMCGNFSGKEKGWALVCTDGYSLGWAKLAGGMFKNHYPKGLRWTSCPSAAQPCPRGAAP